MTTRGMGETEFVEIADIIAECLLNPNDRAVESECKKRVSTLCEKFPLYPHLQVAEPALV